MRRGVPRDYVLGCLCAYVAVCTTFLLGRDERSMKDDEMNPIPSLMNDDEENDWE